MMSFKEFTQAIKQDARLMELLDRCDRDAEPLTDAETQELIDRTEQACGTFDDGELYTAEDLLDDDSYADMFLPEDDDPIWDDSPVDLFGPWWE